MDTWNANLHIWNYSNKHDSRIQPFYTNSLDLKSLAINPHRLASGIINVSGLLEPTSLCCQMHTKSASGAVMSSKAATSDQVTTHYKQRDQ